MVRRVVVLVVMAALGGALVTSGGVAVANHNDEGSPPSGHFVAPPEEPLPPAQAPDAVCSVSGQVTITPGVSAVPTHNYFQFISTVISCASNDARLSGTFTVDADGWTDGDENSGVVPAIFPWDKHGEDCQQGYTRQPADIETTSGPSTASGHVEMVRRVSSAHVWGSMEGPDVAFDLDAALTITPLSQTELVNACAALNAELPVLSEPIDTIKEGVIGGEARLYLQPQS